LCGRVQKAAPVIKVISTTLRLALRIAVPGTKLVTDEAEYKAIADRLECGVTTSDTLIKGGEEVSDWLVVDDKSALNQTREAILSQGSVLQELHALLRKADPANSFGGLVRVQNKRREFLWVHERFVGEY
jgi:internalin A